MSLTLVAVTVINLFNTNKERNTAAGVQPIMAYSN